jgi:hypothetical protein
MQFLVFCSAVIRAVHKYVQAAARRRPRRQRPPPRRQRSAPGDHLDLPRRHADDIFEQIEKGAPRSPRRRHLEIGVDTLPTLPKDAGDRNRTSPFAFTGNKFEFRAVGSNQSISGPLVILNTIVAESLDYIATELEKATKGDASKLNGAVQKLLQDGHQGTQGHHLQRRRLLRSLAQGSGQARPAQPPQHGGSARGGLRRQGGGSALFEKYNVLSPSRRTSRLKISKTIILPAALALRSASSRRPAQNREGRRHRVRWDSALLSMALSELVERACSSTTSSSSRA